MPVISFVPGLTEDSDHRERCLFKPSAITQPYIFSRENPALWQREKLYKTKCFGAKSIILMQILFPRTFHLLHIVQNDWFKEKTVVSSHFKIEDSLIRLTDSLNWSQH